MAEPDQYFRKQMKEDWKIGFPLQSKDQYMRTSRETTKSSVTFSISLSKYLRNEMKSIIRNKGLGFFRGHSEKTKKSLDLDISYSLHSVNKIQVEVNKIDLRKYRHGIFNYIYMNIDEVRSQEKKNRKMKVTSVESYVSRMLDRNSNLLPSLLRFGSEFRLIMQDMIGGEAFNVIPSAAREPEDSATPPGVREDGSGLAATLYMLKKASREVSSARAPHIYLARPRYYFPVQYRGLYRPEILAKKGVFEEIKELVSVVNDQVEGLDVRLDHKDNRFHISVEMSGKEGPISLPFSLMSDGTVKWVALVTAILTNRSIFAIEEPENFIHPLMQKEIVKIMRDATKSLPERSFVLMTTHSETLLNAAYPEEVIVVSMKEGITNAKRPKHLDDVQ